MRKLVRLYEAAKMNLMPNEMGCVQRQSGFVKHSNHQVNTVVVIPLSISLLRIEGAKNTLIKDEVRSTEDGYLIGRISTFLFSELRGRLH